MKDILRVEDLIRNYEMPSREEKKESIRVLKELRKLWDDELSDSTLC